MEFQSRALRSESKRYVVSLCHDEHFLSFEKLKQFLFVRQM